MLACGKSTVVGVFNIAAKGALVLYQGLGPNVSVGHAFSPQHWSRELRVPVGVPRNAGRVSICAWNAPVSTACAWIGAQEVHGKCA